MRTITATLVLLLLISATSFANSQPFVGSLNDEGFVIITALTPTATGGFELYSVSGALRGPDSASFDFDNPDFDFILPGINSFIVARIGTPVFEGELFTGVEYTGDPTSGDLRLQWGDGTTPTEFPIEVDGQLYLSDSGQGDGNNGGGNQGDGNNGGGNQGDGNGAVPEPGSMVVWQLLVACLGVHLRTQALKRRA